MNLLGSMLGLVPVDTRFVIQDDMLERRYVVHGMKASLNEYNVAAALDELGLQYDFQVGVAGGRSIAGGVVLDFLVYTVPYPTPVPVYGEYWHQGAQRQEDLEALALIDEYYQGRLNPAVEVWGTESETKEEALLTLRGKLL